MNHTFALVEKCHFSLCMLLDNTTPVVLPDPVGSRVEEPPAGGGAPPPNVNDQINSSPEHQPADSWEEAAVDGDPLLTPENEEVCLIFHIFV